MKFSDYDKKSGSDKSDKRFDAKTQQQILSLLSKFEGKSEDEIISAILETARKSRKEGKLSDKEIDDFANMISPLIDGDKRKKLYDVIELIKSETPE